MALYSFVYHGYSPTVGEEFCEQGIVSATSHSDATEKIFSKCGYDDKDEPLSIWINSSAGIEDDIIHLENGMDILPIHTMKDTMEFIEKHVQKE